MGRSFGGTLVRILVTVFALLFALAVVGAVVGLVVGIISAVFTAVVVLGLLVVLGAAAAGVLSLLASDDGGGDTGDQDAGITSDWFETEVSVAAGVDEGVGTAEAPGDAASEAARLRKRYLSGEIDEVEYERRLDLLLDDPEAEALFDGRAEREFDR